MKMSENKKFLELLDSLTDALGRSDGQSLEEVSEDIKFEGVDLDSSLKRLMKTVHKSSRAAKRKVLDRAREERLKTETRDSTSFNKFKDWTREELIGKIRELLSTSPVSISAAFRDLESKRDEDLASLLEDLERAKQIASKETRDE